MHMPLYFTALTRVTLSLLELYFKQPFTRTKQTQL